MSDQLVGFPNFNSVQAFLALNNVKFYPILFADGGSVQAGDVYEDLIVRCVVHDKTEALALIEKLYCTCLHKKLKN